MKINWRRPFSLKTRLTFFISLTTVIAFAVFAEMILQSVQNHFAEQDIDNLQQVKTALLALPNNSALSERQKIEKIYTLLAGYRQISVLLLGPQRQILYRSNEGPNLMPLATSPMINQHIESGQVFLWADTLPLGHVTAETSAEAQESHPQPNYRVLATSINWVSPAPNANATLLIALSIDFHLHYLHALKYKLTLIASVISLLIITIVLFVVHKAHQPLRSVSRQIKNITSENLDVRLDPEQVPIELEQLVISFNHMIARIEDVFTRQANFSADIAHEMRTPITNLVTQTEIALSQSRTINNLEEILYSNLEEYNRLAKMINDMLFLAQTENNQLIPEYQLVDLHAEVIKVFEFFEAWAEERHVNLQLDGQVCIVKGDPIMLRRAINNLLSNAIRYTPEEQSVTVHLRRQDKWVELTIENPGKPIAAEHLPRLFDRFYRVDPSRQRKGEGSGIGLAIVKSIVTSHRGKIDVISDYTSTRFTVLLPNSK